MAVYLAVQNSSLAIPAFKDRGIQNLMPGRMSDVIAPMTQADATFSNFAMTVAHAPSHIFAQLNNVSITADGDVRANMKHIVPHCKIFSPQGAFKFAQLSDDNINRLSALGLREDPARKGVFLGTPESKDLGAILALEPTRSGLHNGYASPEAYLAYISSLRLIDILQYITWIGSRGATTFISSSFQKDDLTTTGDNVKVLRDGTDESVSRFYKSWGEENFNDEVTCSIIFPVATSHNDTKTIPDLRIKFNVDKLTRPGLFFPYFPGMVLGDKEIISSTFETYGFPHLSDTLLNCSSLLRKIKAGSAQLASFPAGQALSHAFAVARRAITCGGQFSIVCENGIYAGSVVFGTNLHCFIHGQMFKSVSPGELVQQIGMINEHDSALKKIVQVMKQITGNDGISPVFDISVTDIDTSRKLANWMRKFSQISTSEVEDFETKILDLVEKLRFSETYWEPTQANIIKFLRFVVTGEESLLGDSPSYIGNRMLAHAGDKIFFGLCAFGPIVPSINYGRSKEVRFNIPGHDKEDVNLTVDAQKKRFLQYLPFHKTSIQSAAVQWKSMFNNGYFLLPNGRKGKTEFTNVTQVDVKISTEPFFSEAYSLIKQETNAIRASLQSGKRKKGDDDEGSGPGSTSKKNRKELGEVSMDV